jgi:hypothetical protein
MTRFLLILLVFISIEASAQWSGTSPNALYYTPNKVGVGTATPRSWFHVVGSQNINWQEDDTQKGTGLLTVGNLGSPGSLFVNTPTHSSYYSSGLAVDGAYDATTRISTINIKALGVKYADWGSAMAFHVSSNTSSLEAMRIDRDGDVGIGTTSPTRIVHINRGSGVQVRLQSSTATWEVQSDAFENGSFGIIDYSTGSANPLNSIVMKKSTGYVGLGTYTPDAKLTVNGHIHAKEVRVDLNVPGPDYVFEKEYKLMEINELHRYIEEHKHLPDVASASRMAKEGINLSDMNMVLLKKVEEITLYLIEMDKQIKELKKENAALKAQLNNKVSE